LRSSLAKKPSTPFQRCPSPRKIRSRSRAASASTATSVGTPARAQKAKSFACARRPDGVAKGAMAPSARVLRGSGITRSRSSAGTRPKP
jgi:hypothetical protein